MAKKKSKRKAPVKQQATAEAKQRVPQKRSGELEFFYVKSTGFRVVHADGIHGGVVPTGKHLHMAFFNERNPIPKSQVYQAKDGRLGAKPIRVDEKDGIIREVEFEAIMTVSTAKAIRQWLDSVIQSAEMLQEQNRNDDARTKDEK